MIWAALVTLTVAVIVLAGWALLIAGGGFHGRWSWPFYIRRGFCSVRALGWQLDYRADGWLPLSVREGRNPWRILTLGPLGCITLGRLR